MASEEGRQHTRRTGGSARSRRVFGAMVALSVLGIPAEAVAADCERAAFESAVGEAADALKSLHAEMRPAYQAKLQDLKGKRGWSPDQFVKEAAPLVQDPRIAELDEQSQDELNRIESLGSDGAKADKPECAQLTVLREHMGNLVKIQRQKWHYMFQKIDAELRR